MDQEKKTLVRGYISSGSLLLATVLFIVGGITLIFWKDQLPDFIRVLMLGYGLVTGGLLFLGCLSKYTHQKLFTALSLWVLSAVFWFLPNQVATLYALVFGIYIIFIGLIKFIDSLLLYKNKSPGRLMTLLSAIVFILFAIPLLMSPEDHTQRALFITGLFAVFHGLTMFGDFLVEVLPLPIGNKIKGKIRVNLPVAITALIPHQSLNHLNGLIQSNLPITEESFKTDDKADIEVFIHVTDSGFGQVGHCDFFFEGVSYCYGNYDTSSLKIGGTVGDGVFFTVPLRDEYINFCAQTTGDSIFAFGLKLTDIQIQKIRDAIAELKTHVYHWDCVAQQVEKRLITLDTIPVDYASKAYRAIAVDFNKFKDTSYKTYFVFTTNCVKLVDRILSQAGVNGARPNGIISPGAYYEFFNSQYQLDHSIVVSKQTIHHTANIEHQ